MCTQFDGIIVMVIQTFTQLMVVDDTYYAAMTPDGTVFTGSKQVI